MIPLGLSSQQAETGSDSPKTTTSEKLSPNHISGHTYANVKFKGTKEARFLAGNVGKADKKDTGSQRHYYGTIEIEDTAGCLAGNAYNAEFALKYFNGN